MYRLLVETLLGVNLEGEHLRLAPCFSGKWPGYKIHYRYRQTTYHITIARLAPDSSEPPSLSLDGVPLEGNLLPLKDDRQEHHAEFRAR
jgi:cellobiose phosphorylase